MHEVHIKLKKNALITSVHFTLFNRFTYLMSNQAFSITIFRNFRRIILAAAVRVHDPSHGKIPTPSSIFTGNKIDSTLLNLLYILIQSRYSKNKARMLDLAIPNGILSAAAFKMV